MTGTKQSTAVKTQVEHETVVDIGCPERLHQLKTTTTNLETNSNIIICIISYERARKDPMTSGTKSRTVDNSHNQPTKSERGRPASSEKEQSRTCNKNKYDMSSYIFLAIFSGALPSKSGILYLLGSVIRSVRAGCFYTSIYLRQRHFCHSTQTPKNRLPKNKGKNQAVSIYLSKLTVHNI